MAITIMKTVFWIITGTIWKKIIVPEEYTAYVFKVKEEAKKKHGRNGWEVEWAVSIHTVTS
jgi:hypothetical protein